MSNFSVRAIGVIRSDLKRREDAPRQGPEGAPDAWLEIEPQFAEALLGMEIGHELIIITWLHQARRDVLTGHPCSDEAARSLACFTPERFVRSRKWAETGVQ
jgi:tRNA (Thr-GGU) A37 N-methylase